MKVEKYTALANGYDNFMNEIPYGQWTAFIGEILADNGIKDGLICDLGCGSGIITTALSDLGYDMIGIDDSIEMLEQAEEKKEGRDILYLAQDIRGFELYGSVRAVISTCDVLNYITEKEDISRIFGLVHNYLDPNGLFIFDLNTKYYYSMVCADNTFTSVDENGAYIWENDYDDDSGINSYSVTLFEKSNEDPDGREYYERYEEYHIEKAYDIADIKQTAEKNGFTCLSVNDGYSSDEIKKDSCRAVFIMKKNG